MRPLALVALLALACGRATVPIEVVTDLPSDGGVRSCSTVNDLRCVNYINFDVVRAGGDVESHCVLVTRALDSLCDLSEAIRNQEIFRLDPDEEVSITLTGRRVYPAKSCQVSGVCPARELFSGSVDSVRVGHMPGGVITIPITHVASCGDLEEWRPLEDGDTCGSVCFGTDRVVCDGVVGGCLCRVPGTGRPDAGLADAGAMVDASADAQGL